MGIFTVIGRKVLSMKLQASSTQIKTVTVSFTMYLFKKNTKVWCYYLLHFGSFVFKILSNT